MTVKKSTTKGRVARKAGSSPATDALADGVPAKFFKRRAVARTLAAARQKNTEADFEAELIAQTLASQKLDTQTHVNTVGFLAVLFTKFRDLNGTQRQALLSDPDFARVLYPHIKLAFPKQAKEAFDIYFKDLAVNAPHILDEIQQLAEK